MDAALTLTPTVTAMRADDIDADDVSEQDWARLEAKYRAKYKEDVERYRERFGEEPDLCILVAAEARAECNNMTEEERARARAYGMALYNASSATPHDKHTVCS